MRNDDLTIAFHREGGACWSWSFQLAGFNDYDKDERAAIALGRICSLLDMLHPRNAEEVTGASALCWGNNESFYFEKEEIEPVWASLKERAA